MSEKACAISHFFGSVVSDTTAKNQFFFIRCRRHIVIKSVILTSSGRIATSKLFLTRIFFLIFFFKMRLVQFYNKNSSELKVGAQLGENGDVVELSIGSALEFIESGPAAWKMVSRYF